MSTHTKYAAKSVPISYMVNPKNYLRNEFLKEKAFSLKNSLIYQL